MAGGFEQTKEELQRTVREVLRVLLHRRWAFLLPFCVGATAVFIFSHRLPREYKASTTFERRNPIPISKVLERSGPVSLESLHESLMFDMIGQEALLTVADRLGLTKDLPRNADGELTAQGRKQRESIASRLQGMLDYDPLQTGTDLDRIQVLARGGDAELVARLANAVRENYFEFSREKFLGRLSNAREFYQAEIEATLKSVDLHERQLETMQDESPYVDPYTSREASQRATAIELNAETLEHRIEEHRRKAARLEAELAALPEAKLLPSKDSDSAISFLESGADLERERRRLIEYITTLENTMMQNRIEKGMLDRHPDMQVQIRKKEQATSDLAALNGRINSDGPATAEYSDDAAVVALRRAERQRLSSDLAELNTAIAVAQEQLAEAGVNLSEHEKLRAQSQERRNEYRQMQSSLDEERSHLEGLRSDERKLARILEIDAKDQGMEFITIEEASASGRPVSPRAESILMLALGVGLALGACTVFLREFFDHTFHSAAAVGTSLGVPVLEGIDEILLPADRRRTLLKKLALVPVACLCLGVVALSGGLTYLSLQHPQHYKRIVEKAGSALAEINVLG